jgi:hypothetical protein
MASAARRVLAPAAVAVSLVQFVVSPGARASGMTPLDRLGHVAAFLATARDGRWPRAWRRLNAVAQPPSPRPGAAAQRPGPAPQHTVGD